MMNAAKKQSKLQHQKDGSQGVYKWKQQQYQGLSKTLKLKLTIIFVIETFLGCNKSA